jgi:hypothetical protein
MIRHTKTTLLREKRNWKSSRELLGHSLTAPTQQIKTKASRGEDSQGDDRHTMTLQHKNPRKQKMPELANQVLGAYIKAGCTATLKAQHAPKPIACEQSHSARLQVTEAGPTDAPWQKHATIDSPKMSAQSAGGGVLAETGHRSHTGRPDRAMVRSSRCQGEPAAAQQPLNSLDASVGLDEFGLV